MSGYPRSTVTPDRDRPQAGGFVIRARQTCALFGALVTCLLLFAGVAYSASSAVYAGRTSQGNQISFSIASSYLRRLNFMINVRCPNGLVYRIHDYAFPAIPLIHSKVNESFTSSSPRATATVKAAVLHKSVTGALSDTTYVKGRSCRGSATFSAHASS